MAPTKNKSHLLIAGCGYVGREVLRQCMITPDCRHHPLTGTAGSTESVNKIRQLGAQPLKLNLDESPNLVLPNAPWSLLYLVPPGRNSQTDQRLSMFLGAAAANPPERVTYISTSGVYGDRAGGAVSECDAIAPATDRAKRRADAEEQVRAFAAEHDLQWVILRVPGIYGPGRLRLSAIQDAEPVLREEDCGPGNRIHRDDLAACCLQALRTPNHGQIFNVCDDEHATSTAFTLEVARQAGLPAPPQITLAEARERFSAMRLSFLEESRQLDNARMHQDLKVALRYPDMASGIAASLAMEIGANGATIGD